MREFKPSMPPPLPSTKKDMPIPTMPSPTPGSPKKDGMVEDKEEDVEEEEEEEEEKKPAPKAKAAKGKAKPKPKPKATPATAPPSKKRKAPSPPPNAAPASAPPKHRRVATVGKGVCVQCGATSTPQWREGPAGEEVERVSMHAYLCVSVSVCVYVFSRCCEPWQSM